MRYSKVIVPLIIFLNVAFTIMVLKINANGQMVSDSLIVAWFGFTTGELWALASIRKTKAKGENKDEKKTDE